MKYVKLDLVVLLTLTSTMAVSCADLAISPAASSDRALTAQLETSVRPFTPSMVVDSIVGSLSQVTAVHALFVEAGIELPLRPVGSGSWQAELTLQQLRSLLETFPSGMVRGELVVVSENAKHRTETRRQALRISSGGASASRPVKDEGFVAR